MTNLDAKLCRFECPVYPERRLEETISEPLNVGRRDLVKQLSFPERRDGRTNHGPRVLP
jgi:hypothetical protein